ncbi:MAG: beta-N-acetylhexosaminidase, partial [Bacteroidales bacterium]|nr:beta-N-acetylhexosaminidase [Bacteroidales bacterium]
PKAPEFHVVPMPESVTPGEGVFQISGKPFYVEERLDTSSRAAVERFASQLSLVSGKASAVSSEDSGQPLRFLLNPNLGEEEYALNVKKNGVNVEASAFNGFLYAIETLKQMLPEEIYGSAKASAKWNLPVVSILDSPRFSYRGVHLDPCRHFWSVEETKRIIDIAAAFKLNRFHWHLTDDQGWRVEIKSYPRLTEVGAWWDVTLVGMDFEQFDGVRHGGFYTQDELREVVAYAAERGITVIPEIDLPGHMVAALASYPELGCTGGPYEVRKVWGIAVDILCAGNDEVFTFLDKVFDELVDIFPSEYIHIGGDECFGSRRYKGEIPWDNCPKCRARMRKLGIKKGPEARHYLQNYVTARVQKMLEEKGRKIIGWDEILQGNLAPGATVMSWRGTKGGIEAASRDFDVIMSPNKFLYLDYYQSKEQDKEPLAIGHYLPLEMVYGYETYEGMEPGTEDHIIGVQANLWTEYISTPEHLEYMLLPRLCAASEVQWCSPENKDYARFDASVDHLFRMFDVMGYTYAKHARGLIGLPGSEQKAAPAEDCQ